MSDSFPKTVSRPMQFDNGCAIGFGHRWENGVYCSILTRAGIVGCGIYDLAVAGHFDQAIAIAKGTPTQPLAEPEDLLEAKIVGVTPRAKSYGVEVGMTGRQAAELLLAAK